jgi:hypothetical protein
MESSPREAILWAPEVFYKAFLLLCIRIARPARINWNGEYK